MKHKSLTIAFLTLCFSTNAFAEKITVKTCAPVRAEGSTISEAKLIRDTSKTYPDNLSMDLVIMGESTSSAVVEMKSLSDSLRYRLKDGVIGKNSTAYFFQTNDSYAILLDQDSKDEDSLAPILTFLNCK